MSRGRSAFGWLARGGANVRRLLRRGVARMVLPAEGFWLHLRVTSPIPELPTPSLLASRGPALSFLQVLQLLSRAGADPSVRGVVLRLSSSPGGRARAAALRRALAALREAGKPVLVWAESYSGDQLAVAAAASRVILPRSGNVFLGGVRAEAFFLRDLLAKVGVAPEVVRIGAYKTAGEMFTRDSLSPEQREQLGALVDAHYDELVAAVSEGRGLAQERVRELVDGGPYVAADAVEAGLADACLYPDELPAQLRELDGTAETESDPEADVPVVDARTYAALRAADPHWRPLGADLPRLAYVVARGTLHRGRGTRGIGADPYRQLLDRLARRDDVRGVLIRVDSPGGDVVGSDLVARAVRRLRRKKPVVVSMGDVAASGGYMLAAAADAILAEAGTLTGSIGVVGGKINAEGLYERLGVRKQVVERGARAGMLAEERSFRPDERHALRAEMEALYDLFVAGVAEGRGMDPAAVDAAGRGRVWSGSRARALGLVDGIGGPVDALLELRRRAGLSPDEPVLLEPHPRLSPWPALPAWLPASEDGSL